MSIRYFSVCSGIEAATVAWKPLGWHCAGVSEIDRFPRAVLEHRLGAVPVEADHVWSEGQNFTPLFGDFTKIEAHHVGPVDVLVGGTPCQSFSVAGKRLGLDDPRGNLTLEFLALAQRVRPTWILWENVPGILSHDGGRTFGTFLGLLEQCGFRWAYRVLDAQFTRVGRFGRAVPQRRRRVFVVGYSGAAGINPAAVLFDRESLRWNPAPRRQAGEGIAPTLAARTRGGGGLGTDFDCDGGLIPNVSPALKARDYKGPSSDGDGDGDGDGAPILPVAHSLRPEGFDASEDGTGRRTPIVPVQQPYSIMPMNSGKDYKARETDIAQPIMAGGPVGGNQGGDVIATMPIAFSAKDHGGDAAVECSPTLRAGGHAGSHANAGVMPAVAFDMRGREGGAMPEGPHDTANIRAASGGSSRSYAASEAWGVRRLTPRECARLQGFPDDWAMIPWRGKPAEQCPDGPQYRAYGNSMAVNVMCWLGERIDAVARITDQQGREAAA